MKRIADLLLLAASLAATAAMAQEPPPPTPEINIDRDEPLFEFHFGYSPTGDSAFDSFLRREAGRLEEENRSEWREILDHRAHLDASQREDERASYWHEYYVKGQTPQLISLITTDWVFTGGAHGNSWWDNWLWDRHNRDAIPFQSLFSDWPATRLLLREPVCFAVGRATFVREGGNPAEYSVQDDGVDPNLPDGCPAVDDVSLIPVGQIGQPFDRLMIRSTSSVHIAEVVDAEIPVTAELIRLLAPRWRRAFRVAPVDAPAPSP